MLIAMVLQGMSYRQIAKRMHIARRTVDNYMKAVTTKIPGDLPPRTKILFWSRGASKDQLTGEGWTIVHHRV